MEVCAALYNHLNSPCISATHRRRSKAQVESSARHRLLKMSMRTMKAERLRQIDRLEAFQESCFGHFMRFTGESSICGLVLIGLFRREVLMKNPQERNKYERWFRVNHTNIRFSKTEFSMVSRLRFGTSPFDPHAVLVENSKLWDTFPWGKFVFQRLCHYLEFMETHVSREYKIYGFLMALQWWAHESIPVLGSRLGKPSGTVMTIPRGDRWRCSKTTHVNLDFLSRVDIKLSEEERRQPYMVDIDIDILDGIQYSHGGVEEKAKEPKLKAAVRLDQRVLKRPDLIEEPDWNPPSPSTDNPRATPSMSTQQQLTSSPPPGMRTSNPSSTKDEPTSISIGS
ncbi:hypothetical protein PHJA_000217100 [Phtheirospermum japonicum]|uniref:DUF1985 domain-containing protein n=1 Tax=Phtheirospermum japonicum TaxID=374723 RepID=A0A830B6V8_9LAMI|nr:hypothetical protein PHJA_000217100 [Phtheirospermum japonicum]